MSRIKKLDPSIVNKIAAGEVIERPASVVKELIENALDGGARRIDVALEEGGAKLIRVSDDGCGMPPEDLPLAVAPHATSKISTVDDLFHIRSLGFRGEALASIAAVSHLRLCSRPAGQIEGHELSCVDGESTPPKPCPAAPGTSVEVRHLFGNVPARRKFLRQPATEVSHVTEQMTRLALAHPDVKFSLSHNGRPVRELPVANDRRTRIADCCGPELADCLLAVRREERDLEIEAYLAPPAQTRASTKWQYLFLNGRHIVDRRIGYAIREAFRGLVENDRFPVAFIFLRTPPGEFDVNVHPTKIEVRWRDAGLVQSQVLAVLRETLLSHDLTPALRIPPTGTVPPWPDESAHQQGARQALADYLKAIDPTQARIRFQPPPFPTRSIRPSIGSTAWVRPSEPPPAEQASAAASWPSGLADRVERPMPAADRGEAGGTAADIPLAMFGDEAGRNVLQVHNTYLVAQTEDGIIIVDQHALHERILYEKFREQLLAGPLESQRLLMPVTLEASPRQVQAAEEHGGLLHRLGIDVSAFGPAAVAVQSFPAMLPDEDIHGFVADLLDKLAESEGPRNETAEGQPSELPQSEEAHLHRALDMMACKAAVKAGDPLTGEEIQALLAQRHLVQRSSNCPHGRPTTLQLTTRDLERQFKRI
jgi:DNA mismatch repair protein MutL